MAGKKSNYLTKKVAFNGKEMTLFSLDGVTWSTRPDELEAIIERHNTEQATFSSDLKGEEREKVEKEKPKVKPKKFARVHNDDEIDEVIEEDLNEEEIEDELPPLDEEELDLDDEVDDEAPMMAKKPLGKFQKGGDAKNSTSPKMMAKGGKDTQNPKSLKAPAKLPPERSKAKPAKPAKAPKAKSKMLKAAPKSAKAKKVDPKPKKKGKR